MSKREVEDIDEAALLASIKEQPQRKFAKSKIIMNSQLTEQDKQPEFLESILDIAQSEQNKSDELTKQNEQTVMNEEMTPCKHSKVSVHSEQNTQTVSSKLVTPSDNFKRIGNRQRKVAFEEYRQLFLQAPKIEDRKPVFVSRKTRDNLDRIVRQLGDRKMSVSGLIENLARHHLEIYKEDIEQWRKL